MKFLSAATSVLFNSLSVPVYAMFSAAHGIPLQPVPVQDYTLTFTCGRTLYPNGQIDFVLGRVYGTRRESRPYPMVFNKISYGVSTTVYIFPLLPNFRLYSDGLRALQISLQTSFRLTPRDRKKSETFLGLH
ncbi:putative secreted effector protein [Blumeria graminis f. sp. tritici 96224]|uniref:Putative secreted effector protein n=1 Tax=Blumeria graminis f. sp. tritici 96224 TaxID=1268274 RepID=A0A656KMG7_BLUGR|nr:putative secreted effector protein [Blumeria graminis f. sp. tritici 96224]